jgi:hypothetical protein
MIRTPTPAALPFVLQPLSRRLTSRRPPAAIHFLKIWFDHGTIDRASGN